MSCGEFDTNMVAFCWLMVLSDCGVRRGYCKHWHVKHLWPWPWSLCKDCSVSTRHHPFVGYWVSRGCHRHQAWLWETYWGSHLRLTQDNFCLSSFRLLSLCLHGLYFSLQTSQSSSTYASAGESGDENGGQKLKPTLNKSNLDTTVVTPNEKVAVWEDGTQENVKPRITTNSGARSLGSRGSRNSRESPGGEFKFCGRSSFLLFFTEIFPWCVAWLCHITTCTS
jgi:hypothetical protein